MRTKTFILMAAVAAAGLAQSMAQVYSINTVGYVNVPVLATPKFTLLANPLDNGTNDANSLLVALPNKSTLQTWGGAAFASSSKGGGVWAPNFALPVGTGFFVKNNGALITNTFVGNVVPGPGTSITSSVPAILQLVGTKLPVSGNANDVGVGTVNLNATLPNKSTAQTWNEGTQAFDGATKGGGVWVPNFAINPGTGFFIKANSATNWIQTYP